MYFTVCCFLRNQFNQQKESAEKGAILPSNDVSIKSHQVQKSSSVVDEIEDYVRSKGIDCACSGEDDNLKIFVTKLSESEEIINIFVKASKKLAKPYHMNEKEVIELFKNVLETNYSSKMLDDFVSSISSKKGTTEAGVNYIKSQKIEKIIYTSLQRAYERSKEIDSEKKNTKS